MKLFLFDPCSSFSLKDDSLISVQYDLDYNNVFLKVYYSNGVLEL